MELGDDLRGGAGLGNSVTAAYEVVLADARVAIRKPGRSLLCSGEKEKQRSRYGSQTGSGSPAACPRRWLGGVSLLGMTAARCGWTWR